MQYQDRIWDLTAKKLSGEATAEELAELQQLLQDHPEMVQQVGLLSAIWQPTHKKIADSETENAFNRHLHRMARLEKEQQEEQSLNQRAVAWNHKRNGKLFTLPFYNGMLGNYAKIAWRNVTRNKAFSFVNITGLALGIACSILILIWVQNETSTDKSFSYQDRIYQVMNNIKLNGKIETWGSTPMVMGPAIKTSIPEVEDVVRLNWVGAFTFHYGDKHIETQGFITDSGFLKMFDFPLLEGSSANALSQPHGVVITEKLAHKLFGNASAFGREIKIDSNAVFTITGVLKDLPPNTSFRFEYLIPWSYTKEVGWESTGWENNTVSTFVLTKKGASKEAMDKKIVNFLRPYVPNPNSTFFMFQFSRRWLHSRFENGVEAGGQIELVKLFTIIASFILLIACINYMNLGTARSAKRAKEVGIRKVVGAGKGELVRQFIGESILFAFIAGVIAIGIVHLALPWFSRLSDRRLSIPFDNYYFWLYGIGFLLLTGIVAGSYPAFYLSAFKPIRVLKGTFKATHALVTPRKVLVVLQFTFAITLIICTLVIYQQISYAQKRDTGYSKDNLVFVYMKGDMVRNYRTIKTALLNSNAVQYVTRTNSPITEIWGVSDGYSWKGKPANEHLSFGMLHIDNDFIATMGLQLVAGRDINTDVYPTDSLSVLINEAAAKIMGFKNPIGETLTSESEIDKDTWRIVGVVKDFMPPYPYDKIHPVMMIGPRAWAGTMTFKLNPANSTADNLATIGRIINEYNPGYPFEYNFVDKTFAFKFENEEKIGTLAVLFAGLTIFISCLGLFALAAYMAENRIKEIGVRKVLGASVSAITTLLSRDFFVLVMLAFIVASPIAWWCMNSWLNNFAYHINISWWFFIVTGVFCTIITVITVSYQAIKAAIANPIIALRNE